MPEINSHGDSKLHHQTISQLGFKVIPFLFAVGLLLKLEETLISFFTMLINQWSLKYFYLDWENNISGLLSKQNILPLAMILLTMRKAFLEKKRIKIWSEWWWNIHELELFVVPSSKQTHGKIKENVLSISCYKWNGNVESKLWKYFIRGNLCLNILNALYKEVLVKYCVTGYSLILSTICCILVAGNRFEIN